jgi:hypothetical protein
MSLWPQLARSAVAGLCAVAVASCGGSTKTASSTATTGTSSTKAVFGQSVVLQLLSGTVLIKLPSAAAFVHLRGVRQVPVGTEIDARVGLVRLTAALPTSGKLAVADFREGDFEVRQSSGGNGEVDLKLKDTKSVQTTCTGKNGTRQLTTRLLGLLLGTGTGPFRTEGDRAAASVLGTDWGVRNRCDGTLTVVRRGTVLVSDFHLHRNVTVRAGHSYLARAG